MGEKRHAKRRESQERHESKRKRHLKGFTLGGKTSVAVGNVDTAYARVNVQGHSMHRSNAIKGLVERDEVISLLVRKVNLPIFNLDEIESYGSRQVAKRQRQPSS